MSIVLHIERLVLDEALLGSEHPGAVRAAVERELAQLLAQPGAVETLRRQEGAMNVLPSVTLPTARRSRHYLGPRIATAVQQGLGIPSAVQGWGK